MRSHPCSQACESGEASETPTPQLRYLTELQAEHDTSMCLLPWELLHSLQAQNADQSGDPLVSPKAWKRLICQMLKSELLPHRYTQNFLKNKQRRHYSHHSQVSKTHLRSPPQEDVGGVARVRYPASPLFRLGLSAAEPKPTHTPPRHRLDPCDCQGHHSELCACSGHCPYPLTSQDSRPCYGLIHHDYYCAAATTLEPSCSAPPPVFRGSNCAEGQGSRYSLPCPEPTRTEDLRILKRL